MGVVFGCFMDGPIHRQGIEKGGYALPGGNGILVVASSEVMFVRVVPTVGEEEEVSDAVELEETPPGGRHGSLWIRDET